MFRAFSHRSSGAQWLQWQPLVLPSYRGDSRTVFVVGPARPRTQHSYHHDTKVKPEAAAAVVEVLMMGGRTPETCWAVNRRQDNKLKNCCIWLVIYLNHVFIVGYQLPAHIVQHSRWSMAFFAVCVSILGTGILILQQMNWKGISVSVLLQVTSLKLCTIMNKAKPQWSWIYQICVVAHSTRTCDIHR
jgi:hypothetical protein